MGVRGIIGLGNPPPPFPSLTLLGTSVQRTKVVKKENYMTARSGIAKIVEGYLGAYGCRTRLLETNDDLAEFACRSFGLALSKDIVAVQRLLEAMGKKGRGNALAAYVRHLWPRPTPLWPSDARIRYMKRALPPVRRDIDVGSAIAARDAFLVEIWDSLEPSQRAALERHIPPGVHSLPGIRQEPAEPIVPYAGEAPPWEE